MKINLVLFFIAVSWMIFIPYWVMFFFGLRRVTKKKLKVLKNDPEIFIIQITTSGRAHDSISCIIEEINEYQLDFGYDLWIVTEENDLNDYPAEVVLKVPYNYKTLNNSKYKTRALCYSHEKRIQLGLVGKNVKILFLDDDSLPTEDYINTAFHSNYDIAQGIISSRRNFGVSLLPSVQDSIRTSDCIAFCSYFNTKGEARIIHGEGLVVRANVENEIGWDYGECLAEDLVFGRKATRMFNFGFIPEYITIAPPKSIDDFFKQRRRWVRGQISALKLVDKSQRVFIISRYLTAIMGAFSFLFVLLDQIITFNFPFTMRIIFFINTIGWVLFYAIGNYLNLHSLKWVLVTVLLAFPAGLLETCAFLYGILTKPTGFDVIEK